MQNILTLVSRLARPWLDGIVLWLDYTSDIKNNESEGLLFLEGKWMIILITHIFQVLFTPFMLTRSFAITRLCSDDVHW